MRYVLSNSFRSRFIGAAVLPLGLSAAVMAPGCGDRAEHQKPKAPISSAENMTAREPLNGSREPDDEKLAVPRDEQSEWVPMTGNERVIVDKIPLLTDGAAVQPAPAEADASVDRSPPTTR